MRYRKEKLRRCLLIHLLLLFNPPLVKKNAILKVLENLFHFATGEIEGGNVQSCRTRDYVSFIYYT